MIVNSEFEIYTNRVLITAEKESDFKAFKQMVDDVLGWTMFQSVDEQLSIGLEVLLFLIDELDEVEFTLNKGLDSIVQQVAQNKKFLNEMSKIKNF